MGNTYINKDNVLEIIKKAGLSRWADFSASELHAAGNAQRCDVVADGKEAHLNIYFKKDGSTTISPTGKNADISGELIGLIEAQSPYSCNVKGKNHTIKAVPADYAKSLIDYLGNLDGVACAREEVSKNPKHTSYVFTSSIGDRLTINSYLNGTLTLQGKPAWLFSEAIGFLSYCKDVSVDDIVESVNAFHDIKVTTTVVRNELEALLPRSYPNIDDMIIKLLSPAISLRRVQLELEDYSCYAFPALRALEGYIKYLLSLKGIIISDSNNFGTVFDGKPNFVVKNSYLSVIANSTYSAELGRLYKYFATNRHVIFHTNMPLIGTTLLEDKQEADEIVNNVLNLIETSYVRMFP